MMEGVAFGVGSSVARMAVNSVFGGVGSNQHHLVDHSKGEGQYSIL
jgi:hypothetical protein